MTEKDLTENLAALLIFIESHIAREIPDRDTFNPYGILLKREKNALQMVFLETTDDSDSVLKGRPAPQMARRIEDMIHSHRTNPSVESAALVMDAHLRATEGGDESEAVIVWLDDRGRQSVRVILSYELKGGKFCVTSRTIEARHPFFLPPNET